MAIPEDRKEQAIYHTILSEMHRIRGVSLNLQTIDVPESADALSEHFTRERTLVMGKLMEWKRRRPDIYKQADDDFQNQIGNV